MNSIQLMEQIMSLYPDVSEETKKYVRSKIQENEDIEKVKGFAKVKNVKRLIFKLIYKKRKHSMSNFRV